MGKVADDAMLPHYAPVGGEVLKDDDLGSIVGKTCIVENGAKGFIVRNLKEGDRYLLVPSDLSQPVVGLQEIKSVAKVIWWRSVSQNAGWGYENLKPLGKALARAGFPNC